VIKHHHTTQEREALVDLTPSNLPSAREGPGLARITTSESAAAAANLPKPSTTFSLPVFLAANVVVEVADGDFATNAAHGANKHRKNAAVFMVARLVLLL
jgi:hypothetical protein